MLVLSRKKNESIIVDDRIVITVVEIRGDKVRLGINAPRDVPVHRSEVFELLKKQQAEGGVAKTDSIESSTL
jgi:carbon storage regulator